MRTRRRGRIRVCFTIRRRLPRSTKPAAPAVCAAAVQTQFCLAKRRIIPWGHRNYHANLLQCYGCLFHLGGPMANLDNAIQQLRQDRKLAQLQVEKLDSAIVVLEGLTGRSFATASRNGAQPKRVVSAAARRRMARAQRARWAKLRKEPHSTRPGKVAGTARVKRTLSIAAKRKIAAAQRARWAQVRAQRLQKAG
jgi:hypothetical protein